MDDNSVFLDRKRKEFIKMSLTTEEEKRCSIDNYIGICLFPRNVVDARPALSLILRSIAEATSAPYDVDTILCALLLEQHDLLKEFQSPGRINISPDLIETLLTQFDQNPDKNPLDDPEFQEMIISRYIVKPIVPEIVSGPISQGLARFGTFSSADTPDNSVDGA
jgi:hypothetical protein